MSTAKAAPVGPDTIVADTYRIIDLLGEGGMGAVWRAEHMRLPGKSVAIKVLNADCASDPEVLARFRREAEIASRLGGHPNIVQIHDYNTLEDGAPYLVLEMLEGESLDATLTRGPLSEEATLQILAEVSAALRAAHASKVVHRDLKPQNVFLCKARGNKPGPVKVLDFGISKIRGSTTVKTQTETVLGTPQYMGPEQALGKHDQVDARTDIFCLGIMAFEMLAGRPPFTGETLPEVVFKIVYEPEPMLEELAPATTPEMAAAIHRALSKKQEDRFADIDEFLLALGLPVPKTLAEPLVSSDIALDKTAVSNKLTADDLAIAQTVDSASARRSGLQLAPPLGAEAKPNRRNAIALVLAIVLGAGVATAMTLFVVGGNDQPKKSKKSSSKKSKRSSARGAAHIKETKPPKAEPPKTVPPKTEPPKTEPPKTETPKTETPKIETPKTETPKTESPKTATATQAKRNPEEPASEPVEEPVRAGLPGLAQLAGLPASARKRLRKAIRAFRAGNKTEAAFLAAQAARQGAGDLARRIEVMARCDLKDNIRANPAARQIRSKALQKRLMGYCARRDVLLDL